MIVNPMFLWDHLRREQELHGEGYCNQLLMLKIWILDEEFIAGISVGYGEKNKGCHLHIPDKTVWHTNWSTQLWRCQKKNGKCENYITIKVNVFPQCFGLYVMRHRQLGFLLNPLLEINVICWLESWYSEKLWPESLAALGSIFKTEVTVFLYGPTLCWQITYWYLFLSLLSQINFFKFLITFSCLKNKGQKLM